MESLKKEDNQTIVVNGMPGSGKTIVAIFLMKYLKKSPQYLYEFKCNIPGFW